MISMPKQSKFIGLVFTRIGMPEAWLQEPSSLAPPPPQQQQQRAPPPQQQQQQNTMFATAPQFTANQHFAQQQVAETAFASQFGLGSDLAELQRMLGQQ